MREASFRRPKGLIAALALAVVTLTAVGPVMAKGPRDTGSRDATCWVRPDPVPNGSQYTVSGSGYAPALNLTIFVGGGTILMTTSSAAGNFNAGAVLAGASSGDYPVVVYAQSDTKHHNPLATCTMTVQ